MRLAPVILFAYNRPEHTRRTLEALRLNKLSDESVLYIFSDGPRSEGDVEAVQEVRRVIAEAKGFARVNVVESERNKGLANSIIDGVTHVIEQHGRVIVLEDDLITSPWFLTFMNEALERFKDVERVGHIHAFIYPEVDLPETFLIQWSGSTGWATWGRAWKHFNDSGAELLRELEERELTRRFDFDGTNRYTRMLRRQVAGEIDSWAIRWYASMFLSDLLSLNVGRSLIENIGFDGSGVNSGDQEIFITSLHPDRIVIDVDKIEENVEARREIGRYYVRAYGFWAKVKRRIERHLKIKL